MCGELERLFPDVDRSRGMLMDEAEHAALRATRGGATTPSDERLLAELMQHDGKRRSCASDGIPHGVHSISLMCCREDLHRRAQAHFGEERGENSVVCRRCGMDDELCKRSTATTSSLCWARTCIA